MFIGYYLNSVLDFFEENDHSWIYNFSFELADYWFCILIFKKIKTIVFYLVNLDYSFYVAELLPLLIDKLCCCHNIAYQNETGLLKKKIFVLCVWQAIFHVKYLQVWPPCFSSVLIDGKHSGWADFVDTTLIWLHRLLLYHQFQ